ncbi:hypothetical protein ABBQ38_004473 [Trebouxia sp. C0009 RCD-2024]
MHLGATTDVQRVPLSSAPRHTSSFSRVLPQRRPHRRSAVRAQGEGATADANIAAQESETAEQALQRRLKESARVEERVSQIFTAEDFQHHLEQAGDNLVVLEVESSEVCQTGLEEIEHHWKEDKEASLGPCKKLKHVLQRTARDSPDVRFVTLEADGDEGLAACDTLGIEVLPTLQFWKNKRLLWEHRGVTALDQDLSEGVLYYADHAANGVKASQYITDIHNKQDLDTFLSKQDDNVLTVLDVCLRNAGPCIHIFPAVLALAKNFTGYAHFARLIGDESDETQQVLKELKVNEVPTFLFYRAGKSTGRHVGSSRADLIGQILQQQSAYGIRPPVTGQGAQTRRRKIERRV